jgi:transcriptional regulator with PAS, ATPase and Fis domain
MDCIDVAARMAQSRAPVLLTGESGSGKELFAAAIHASSFVSGGPFVAVNCGTLSKELAVTELLGYEPGAFTGASPKGRPGKFEQADRGTIFLDEIGELSTEVQVHLLRVLQDHVVVRVGGNNTRQTNVRVIAATNRNLESEAAAGRFRTDLYYRLKVLNLSLPPLRERVKDIELLARRYIRRLHENYGLGIKTISRPLLLAMEHYHWPGNVRELHGVLERMYILSGNPTLTLQDLPRDIDQLATVQGSRVVATANQKLDQIEANAIRSVLAQSGSSLSQIARQLGISRTTLYRRMKMYDIARPE